MPFEPNDGIYRIAFTHEQYLTASDNQPGTPLLLLPPGQTPGEQRWRIERNGDACAIRAAELSLYVGFDGDPDMHEMAILQPRPRLWRLEPGGESDTYSIGVPDTDPQLRLGMSLLRIFPPRVALAPAYGDMYQAWTLQKAE
jgi:hypothetical protein